jgi:hypothetical protein
MKINYRNIIFSNTIEQDLSYRKPIPASSLVPDWYKETSSYIGGTKKPMGQGETSATVKRCMPVFDAMTSGYIIPTPTDVYVSKRDDGMLWYEWPSLNPLGFHPIEQAPLHPAKNGFPYPKWINPWAIKTPKGYSCLFVTPFHRDSIFTVLPGIVDTDQYFAPVNFPFVLNDTNFEGIIPAGTPMAQVIPFKREGWKHSFGDVSFLKEVVKINTSLRNVFFDSYKKKWWNKKEYR